MASLLLPVSLFPVAAPYDFQAFEREVFIDVLNGARRASDQLGLPAGGDHLGLVAEFRHQPADDAVDQSGESIVEPRLNAVHCVAADEPVGLPKIHHWE